MKIFNKKEKNKDSKKAQLKKNSNEEWIVTPGSGKSYVYIKELDEFIEKKGLFTKD